jgi:L-threonylcarbamoyladenylate synthase
MPEPGPALLAADDPEALADAVLALRSGAIVGIPTETVYGIGVIPEPQALAAVIAAKARPQEKGIALLIDGLDQVDGLVEVSGPARTLAERYWPGALTLVLPLRRAGSVPEALTGGRDTLGLRVPDHPVPRALARELGPIAVTSANRSGEPAARTASELIEAVGHSLAMVLDDGPVRGGVASTVVAVAVDGSWQVLREGALTSEAIAAAAGGDRP